MQQVKRYASHYLFMPEVGFFKQQVVELKEGLISCIFPLTEEIESVEWMPGVIVLCPENDKISFISYDSHFHPLPGEDESDYRMMQERIESMKLVPYLLYPFDFISMQPVSETQRRLLR